MYKQIIAVSLLLVFGLSAIVLGARNAREEEAVALNKVTLTARDYSFDAPEEIPTGWTRLRLQNEGPDYHHIQLVKLSEGKTVADLVAAFAENPVLPAWAEEVGGPNPPEAGQIAEAIIDLEAGAYALLCTVPDRQGVPHIMHGMVQALTVTEAEGETAVEPIADVSMDLLDFSFLLSSPLSAGKQTIRVNNRGDQPHEVFLARLEPGRTQDDFLASFSPDAAFEGPVWTAQGGLSVIEPGAHGYFVADLEPGQYILACFAPEVGSGVPHLMMGMVQEITVP